MADPSPQPIRNSPRPGSLHVIKLSSTIANPPSTPPTSASTTRLQTVLRIAISADVATVPTAMVAGPAGDEVSSEPPTVRLITSRIAAANGSPMTNSRRNVSRSGGRGGAGDGGAGRLLPRPPGGVRGA